MSHATFALVVGWAGTVLGFVMTYFQYRRAVVVGVEGISLVTWTLFACMGVFWMAYGVDQRSLVIVAGSALVFPLQLRIIGCLSPWRNRVTISRCVALIAVASGCTTLAFGWSVGVLGTGVAMVSTRLPQILELLRGQVVHGVSASAWSVGVVCSVLWVAFYVSEGLAAAIAVNILTLSGTVAIAGLALWRQRDRADVTRETTLLSA